MTSTLIRSKHIASQYPGLRYVLALLNVGWLSALAAGILLRRLAQEERKYPTPITPEFLTDLAWQIARRAKERPLRERWGYIKKYTPSIFNRVMKRVNEPLKPIQYNYYIDHLLAEHGIAPLPVLPEDAPQ